MSYRSLVLQKGMHAHNANLFGKRPNYKQSHKKYVVERLTRLSSSGLTEKYALSAFAYK